jgi:exosome complex RNA-binding protein Csl4
LKSTGVTLFKTAQPHKEALKKAGMKATDQLVSSTGELTADFKNRTFKAVTPKSEAFTVQQGKSVSGDFMSVTAQKSYCTAAAIAVDGLPLAKSGRVLLLHITDVRQENTHYLSGENRVITREPSQDDVNLGKYGTAKFTLQTSGNFKLYALERDGSVSGTVPFRKTADGIEFTADTFRIPGKVVFAYELKKL